MPGAIKGHRESWSAPEVEYRAVSLLTDRSFDCSPHDPRIEDLAQRTVAFVRALPLPDSFAWDDDATAYRLVTTYRRDESPAWSRLMDRMAELLTDRPPPHGPRRRIFSRHRGSVDRPPPHGPREST